VTTTDSTRADQTDTIAFEFDLPHPPEKVWRALTEPALLAEWLLPAFDFGLDPGTEFTFRRDPMPGWDGMVHCRIRESDPPRRLSYAWVAGDIDTVVTFTLAGTPNGTHLTLVQSGFRPDQRQNFGGARYGWTMMGGKLEAVLDRTP
jgi:uncharacterized protein YndB with AHSA1/START domain